MNETIEKVKICPKCGKDKGLPPSLTVYPGYCEKCREELKQDDFVDSTIICMSGKAGSGKDTVAKILVEKHSFLRMALADPCYVVTIYDSDGIKKFSEYVSNEFSVEEIKKV